ncbi:sigma 54-interacting transcriptional regulator [Thalassotalea psychrophila]|uniref:HTH-type transcriptional regulatory protein TyrR n=1 Tax=Thalassotalea psychrophila TaxID=3065647 RepID=A0ABY9TRM5_9GAMM|nr:sigma 54-interacting transcriptional regulator [Colwelliaceae bacterium SQ149]
MRIEIASLDRVGIAQEILAVFAAQNWDLLAMEVSQYHTYVQLKDTHIPLAVIEPELIKISGLKAIRQIELLPGERKSQQLEVLLANIPEPIIDIDKNGMILMVNKAVSTALDISSEQLIGEPLNRYIKEKLRIYLSGQSTTQEVTFANQQYYADITPVKSEQAINGAVIVLRSLANVGRHLSQYQQGQDGGFDSIIGNSETIKQIKNQTKRFASLDLPVLITGETGTGKELLAKALHDNGNRSSKPFLAINCAALPEHLLESELFGYAPGAFTGAQSAGKPGLFELANGGSVFLDEIAEMPVYLQAKLLRFLQDFKIRRVGGIKDRKVNIRVISATHQNLAEQVRTKDFREDLYYRLNVLNLDLPALHQRSEDIPLLVEHFISNAAKQVNQASIHLSTSALEKVCAYSWPGNVRQLQNVLFRVAALAETNIIEEQDIVFDEQTENQTDELNFKDNAMQSWQAAQQKFEQELLSTLYPLYPSTRKLADRLQVSHNKIAMKLRQYKIK